MREWINRLLRIEPGISLGQWAYDRIANNWERIVAAFIAGGGMSYLASITDWMAKWGPFGIGAAGLAAALSTLVGLAWASSLRAQAKVRSAEAVAVEKWKERVDDVNPLAPEFHTKRLRVSDIAHPITRRIARKRFIDCELMGPANLLFHQNVHATGVMMMNCDLVVVNGMAGLPVFNVIVVEDVTILNGTIGLCTLFIPPGLVPQFAAMGGRFLNKTGDPQIDNAPLPPMSQRP